MRGLDFFSQTFLFLFLFYFLSWVPWFYYYWWMMGSMRWKRTWGSYLQKPWSFFTLSSPLFPWSSDLDLYLFIYQSFFNGNWQLRAANCLRTTVYEFPPFLLSSSPPDLCLVISTGHADLTCFSLAQSYRFYLFAGKQRAGNEHIKMMMMRRRCGRAKRGFNLGERERERECHVCVFFFFFSFL